MKRKCENAALGCITRSTCSPLLPRKQIPTSLDLSEVIPFEFLKKKKKKKRQHMQELNLNTQCRVPFLFLKGLGNLLGSPGILNIGWLLFSIIIQQSLVYQVPKNQRRLKFISLNYFSMFFLSCESQKQQLLYSLVLQAELELREFGIAVRENNSSCPSGSSW